MQARHLAKQVAFHGQLLHILNDISFECQSGETLAILGKSGSGKSTLLGLLAGLDNPSQGEVMLLGQSINALGEDARARLRAGRVGFVFQNFQLLDMLTALENVMLPLGLQQHKAAEAVATEWLQKVGLGDRLHQLPASLSGGEQQRVALARAFVTRPEILFADEPTGNLDSETGDTIIRLLFELQKEHHTTLVIVTHDDQLASQCQRQIRLEKGRLVSQPSPQADTLSDTATLA